MSAIKSFYIRGEKATPQKFTPHPSNEANFKITNSNLYSLLQDQIFHK